jgi:hypothetical protein
MCNLQETKLIILYIMHIRFKPNPINLIESSPRKDFLQKSVPQIQTANSIKESFHLVHPFLILRFLVLVLFSFVINTFSSTSSIPIIQL